MTPIADLPAAPEVRLVLACLRSRYDDEDGAEGIAEALRAPLDPELFLKLCRRHAVTPLVHAALAAHRDSAPQPLSDLLDERVSSIRVHNLALAGELFGLVDALGSAGIQVVPYKGLIAAQALYGDVALREFVDLDLLVRPRDVRLALEVLAFRGYEPLTPITDRQLSFLLRTGHDRKLIRDGRYVVEIQWSIAARPEGLPRDVEPLLRRATMQRVGGRRVQGLAKLDEALVLALHGSLHLWHRLSWVCDVAESLRGLAEAEARQLLHVATRTGVRRAFLSGTAMAMLLLHAQPPIILADAIEEDPDLLRAVDQMAAPLTQLDGPSVLPRDHLRLRVALADGRRRRLNLILRAVATPTVSDWHAVRLPAILWPLYYPIRLVRLVSSYVIGTRRPGDWLRDERSG